MCCGNGTWFLHSMLIRRDLRGRILDQKDKIIPQYETYALKKSTSKYGRMTKDDNDLLNHISPLP